MYTPRNRHARPAVPLWETPTTYNEAALCAALLTGDDAIHRAHELGIKPDHIADPGVRAIVAYLLGYSDDRAAVDAAVNGPCENWRTLGDATLHHLDIIKASDRTPAQAVDRAAVRLCRGWLPPSLRHAAQCIEEAKAIPPRELAHIEAMLAIARELLERGE